jgi:hypothetical protein
MVVGLIILGVITVGVETHIDRSLIDKSGFLNASLLGWQLIYILPVAILTNDFFLSGFWMRTFASRTDKDLWIGVSIATVVSKISARMSIQLTNTYIRQFLSFLLWWV